MLTIVYIDKKILKNISKPLNTFLNNYQSIITFILAFSIITTFIIMIINITKLANARDNPQLRKEAVNGILITGICIAILGSLSTIYIILISIIFL